MLDNSIIIRRAELGDSDDIFSLVAADGHHMSMGYIIGIIDSLYVLIYRKRILGVLCGTPNAGKGKLNWAAVHPMYPESSLVTAMINSIQGVFFRQPVNDTPSQKKLILKQSLDKVLSYVKFRGVINGISGKQEF